MSERISDDERQRLLAGVDLLGLIAEDRQVDREGAHHVCCCPVHAETAPSCVIYADGHYHCFGCGAHGDAISYLREARGLDWDSAIAELRRRTGGDWTAPARPAAATRPSLPPERSDWVPIVPVPAWAPPPPSHRHYGDPERLDAYRDAAGQLLGYVARYRSESKGKVTPTWTWCQGQVRGEQAQEWRQRRWDRPYPLCGLDDLAARPTAQVLVVEGEKTRAAAAAWLPGYVVLTHCGGHQAAKHADWSPLAGRVVTLIPDWDWDRRKGPGAYVTLATHLRADIAAAEVRLVDLDDLAETLGHSRAPDGWDERVVAEIADAKAAGRAPDLQALAAAMGAQLPPDGWDLADASPAQQRSLTALIDSAPQYLLPHERAALVPVHIDAAPAQTAPADIDDDDDDGQAIIGAQVADAETDPRQLQLDRELAALPITDADLAERLVRRYGDDMRYDATSERWYVWSGTHWAVDYSGQRWRWALATVRALHREARFAPSHTKPSKYHAAARKAHALRTREGMVREAARWPGLTLPDRRSFDSDPYLLATPTGTLDLRTLAIRPSRREDMIASCTAAPYVPDATHDALTRVIEGLIGDPADTEFRRVLRMICGSCLIGGNRSERIYLLTGKGGAGKSTLFEGMMAALGSEYSTPSSMETFTVSRTEKIRSDIARLDGPRLVVADDTKDGVMLDEGIIKWLTGRTTVVARFLHANEFHFRPRFTPYLLMNGEPILRADDGMRRRLVRLHFSHQIPEAQRDGSIKDAMIDPAVAGSAILAWMVAGAQDYLATAGEIPERFRQLTAETMAGSDPLAEFLSDYLEWRSDVFAFSSDIMAAYEGACREDGLQPVSGHMLGRRLRELGAVRKTIRRDGKVAKAWYGVTLRTSHSGTPSTAPASPLPSVTSFPNSSHTHASAYTPAPARAVTFFDYREVNEKEVTTDTGNTPAHDPIDEDPPF